MAKTGSLAAFKLGESKTAMVNLPTQFVTANQAAKKGYQYSKLVDYAENDEKTSDLNNEAMGEMIDLKEQFKEEGYANRTTATNEKEPIFSSDKLHYNNHDISILRQRLDTAQANGNNIHELAFSLRGDWLVKNNLYDPDTGNIDQDKLKHAEQAIAKTLIEKGFNLPLGESEDDVVWFGVIHQDTDHLNMHLWFAKESKETRPEMLKQEGKYKGQPIGVIPLETIELAKRQFRNQLMASAERQKRTDVLKGLGSLKKEIVAVGSESLTKDRYTEQIKAIYDALPQEQKGRWQVGNSTLTATHTKMAKANQLTDRLLDDVFKNELKDQYQEFKKLGYQFDDFNIEDQGIMGKGQRKLSENKEEELRKRLANQLYRYLNEVEDTSEGTIEQQLVKIRQADSQSKQLKTGLKENFNPETSPHSTTVKQASIHNPQQALPVYSRNNKTMTKISRLWRQDVRAELNAQTKFVQNQKRTEYEQKVEEFEAQQHRGL